MSSLFLFSSRMQSLSFATQCLGRSNAPFPVCLSFTPSRLFSKSKQRSNPTNKNANQPKGKRNYPRPPTKPKNIRQPKGVISPPGARFIPPAMLLPTASPFAYVSMAAFRGEDDPRPSAKSLFEDIVNDTTSEEQSLPFQGLTFEYFPPKSFQHQLPKASEGGRVIPEVAFLGRSNVGKSSLINALMQRDLATCSKHPGRTQQPYYYGLVSGTSLTLNPLSAAAFLVDLPGYGYADAPNQTVDEWTASTQQFLQDRRHAGSLQRLFLLIDARRGISRENSSRSSSVSLDLSVMRWLDEEDIPYSIVVTKADCVGQPQLVKVANEACLRYQQQIQDEFDQIHLDGVDPEEVERCGSMGPVVYLTSAKKKEGLRELRSAVEAEFYVDS